MVERRNVCRRCQFWIREKGKSHGDCHSEKFIDCSRSGMGDLEIDALGMADAEGYGTQFATGESFGCIHFEGAER